MDQIFLISKIWVDNMENHNAYGYEPYTFRLTEDEAKAFVATGRMYTRKDCWQLVLGDMPQYTYKPINKI